MAQKPATYDACVLYQGAHHQYSATNTTQGEFEEDMKNLFPGGKVCWIQRTEK